MTSGAQKNRRAIRTGLVVVLALAVVAVAAWLLRPPPSVRYAGASGAVQASVALRLGGLPAPERVTIDLGQGVKVIAARLP